MINYYVSFLIVSSLASVVIVETLYLVFRALGAFHSIPMIGAHVSSVLMLVNRVFASLLLLSIGYAVDSYYTSLSLLLLYLISMAIVSAAMFLLCIKMDVNFSLFKFVVHRIHHRDVSKIALSRNTGVRRCSVDWAVALTLAISIIGLVLPSLLAVSFREYRATLMQTGFLLNVFATVWNVLVVEKKIASVCETGDTNKIFDLVYQNLYSRGVGGGLTFSICLVGFMAYE